MDRILILSGIIISRTATPVIWILVAMALGLFLWWRFFRSAGLPPKEMIIPAAEDDVSAEPEITYEGPGQLLVRFQTLQQDFEQATKELQRFNGFREIQLQGWQQLSADVIRRILPVLANLEPYLEDTDSQAAAVAQLAYGRLLTELVTIGVTQIVPSPGETFDGKYHLLGPDSEGYPPYRIKSVVQPGYRFEPRIPGASEIVLKPAEVIVETDVERADIEPEEDGGMVEPITDTGIIEPVEDGGMGEPITDTGSIEPVEDGGRLVMVNDDGLIEQETDDTVDPIDKNIMMVSLFEQMPAAMVLDSDDDLEIRRVPLPDEDDDDDIMEIKRMPSPLPDEE